MTKGQCDICGAEIGLFAYKIEFTDGKSVCKNCASKAGIQSSDLTGITFEMIEEWVDQPSKRVVFYQQREAEKREAERIERERAEEERQRQEEQRRIAEGRVRVTIEQVSWTQLGAVVGSGNTIDAILQTLQDRGCQIMNVTCYASGEKAAYVQAVIVYREPPA